MVAEVLTGVGLLLFGLFGRGLVEWLFNTLDDRLDQAEKRRAWLAAARLWSFRVGLGIWVFLMVVAVVAVACDSFH